MKLCINCRHFSRYTQSGTSFDKCSHPEFVKHSPVDGHLISIYCSSERESGKCGPNGKLWEEIAK